MLGRQHRQVEVLVLKGVVEFVSKGALFIRTELATVSNQVHDFVVLVVNADDLLLQDAEQDLNDTFIWIDNAQG